MAEPSTIAPDAALFSSSVYPTEADMAVWNALTAEQKRAVVRQAVQDGLNSGLATLASKDDILKLL